jgi:alkylhydroperoxidase family enzyme
LNICEADIVRVLYERAGKSGFSTKETKEDRNRAMRIKGVPVEDAAPGVRRLYEKSSERLGRVAIPLTAFAHCPEIAEAYSALGTALARSSVVEPRLKTLACVRTAQIAGCPF